MPELITVCWANGKPYQLIYAVQGEMEIFNPSVPAVYSTMNALLREVQGRFPSNHIHLGEYAVDIPLIKTVVVLVSCVAQEWMKYMTNVGKLRIRVRQRSAQMSF